MKRKRVFEIVERSEGNDLLSTIYDWFMIVIIILSLVPLAFKSENTFFKVLDKVTVSVFIIDYLLRWITADYKFGEKGIRSFLRYPISFMAIIDLISILPSLSVVNEGFKIFMQIIFSTLKTKKFLVK